MRGMSQHTALSYCTLHDNIRVDAVRDVTVLSDDASERGGVANVAERDGAVGNGGKSFCHSICKKNRLLCKIRSS